MKIEDCPKFDACSAPICPLDEDYKLRVHLTEDRACLYLREYAKSATRGQLKVTVPDEMYNLIAECHLDILLRDKGDKLGALKSKLVIAEKGKSKMFGKQTFKRGS